MAVNYITALETVQAVRGKNPFTTLFLKNNFAILPSNLRRAVNDRYIQVFNQKTQYDADMTLLEIVKKAAGRGGLLASDDSAIILYAKECAKLAYCEASKFLIPSMQLHYLIQFALSKKVAPPSDKLTPDGQRARLQCEKWWRRALRKAISREVERLAIDLGLVCKVKGMYASDETVKRRQQQKRRNRDLLKTINAVNDKGDEYNLAELSDLGVSNPKLRANELMTRIAGFGAIAKFEGHAGGFFTITCPSKFHAYAQDGTAYATYQNLSPREGQTHLVKMWGFARAALHKANVKVYGFRVAEAHHDGTPHWHMVLYYAPEHTNTVITILRKYAFLVDGSERGADKNRFDYKEIDFKRGTGASYLLKYILKNIYTKELIETEDFEGGKLQKNVNRVEAWAACWGIRQFQQIGGAPVGVWRELRRLGAVTVTDTGILKELQDACDNKDWALYTIKQGGATVARKDLIAKVARVWFDGLRTLYDGYGGERVQGVESACGAYEKTRLHTFFLKSAGVLLTSWSSVNNCNQLLKEKGAEAIDFVINGTKYDKFLAGKQIFKPKDKGNSYAKFQQ